MECLTKDRGALLVFYDFPAEHCKHLRTSNPVESTFATVRHRAYRTKPLSPWFSNLLKPPRNIDVRLDGQKPIYQRSFSW